MIFHKNDQDDLAYSFEKYSREAFATAQYPNLGNNLVYPAIKLAGEAGETADKIGKHWRNVNAGSEFISMGMSALSYSEEEKTALVKELGDVLWYINAIAIELGVSLEEVARQNIIKLTKRQEAGTILGSGDNR